MNIKEQNPIHEWEMGLRLGWLNGSEWSLSIGWWNSSRLTREEIKKIGTSVSGVILERNTFSYHLVRGTEHFRGKRIAQFSHLYHGDTNWKYSSEGCCENQIIWSIEEKHSTTWYMESIQCKYSDQSENKNTNSNNSNNNSRTSYSLFCKPNSFQSQDGHLASTVFCLQGHQTLCHLGWWHKVILATPSGAIIPLCAQGVLP